MNPVLGFAKKHWALIVAVLSCAASVGMYKQRNEGLEQRVEWIEATNPEATAALTKRNADDDSDIRAELGQIRKDTEATRADVAYLRGHLGVGSNDGAGGF